MTVRLVLGVGLTIVLLAFAAKRVLTMYRTIRLGQPAIGRLENQPRNFVEAQLTEVFGQRRLLKWTIPGIAHVFAFWGFVVLGAAILEAYGLLFDEHFVIPLVGDQPWFQFAIDLFAVLVFVAVVLFAAIRFVNSPKKKGRKSRFYGSHLGGAWLVLIMIFNVVWTLLLFRGAQVALGAFPADSGGFASEPVGELLDGLSHDTLEWVETFGIVAHLAVILSFLLIVLYSKHAHIFLAPINVSFKRKPIALGPLLPMTSGDHLIDFEDPQDDDIFGRGKVEDFTWKGLLDFATCTECGRCQSQCPAWNTEKPLSPKLLIMSLRDNAAGKAPYLLAEQNPQYLANTGGETKPVPVDIMSFSEKVQREVERPLVAPAEGGYGSLHSSPADQGVIDPDVLWSCTSCGACVEQCPVDIEHVDHIMDMRRYQVLIESSFPNELNGLFKNLENKGNPWGMNSSDRLAWTEDLDFEVPVIGDAVEDAEDLEYLFWVGCAGAYEDRAKKTTQAVATLLHEAKVNFAVLGEGETCNGDPARRAGNEFLFQMLAQQNVETLNEVKAKRIVVTCAHCFNTLGNEFPQVGGVYEVVHHTQLLDQLVAEGRLTPVKKVDELVTYHDPCYLGRHNGVYAPPRDLLGAAGVELKEMERTGNRSFCCGAGGARMWMEETLGKRVNEDRTNEAIDTGATKVAIGCPFCRVMISDGVATAQADGRGENVQVVDVAELLLSSVRGDA
jgi:Fe-S oxidoreductase